MGIAITLEIYQQRSTVIHEDNQEAIAISKNRKYHGRTKHVDIRHHFVQDKVESIEIALQYCSTNDMVTDV